MIGHGNTEGFNRCLSNRHHLLPFLFTEVQIGVHTIIIRLPLEFIKGYRGPIPDKPVVIF